MRFLYLLLMLFLDDAGEVAAGKEAVGVRLLFGLTNSEQRHAYGATDNILADFRSGRT